MYKWYGRKELDFRAHLLVNRFSYAEKGTVTGRISKQSFTKELPIVFEKLDGYLMAYTLAAGE
jgi:hypothetical protein